MAQSYAKIQKQIELLQRQAQAIRQSETKGVIDRIKVAIEHYALTPEQLFGTGPKVKSKTKSSVPSTANGAKYADGKGNEWSGRGPRPHWLRDALAAGAQLETFQVTSPASDLTFKIKKTKAKVKRAPSALLYANGTGKTWTGRGPKPAWVKAHLDAGKDLTELLQK
ncbi:MAG: hypothetical protein EOP24_38140 [Hyphomicrobiales bacterium]|nr:MAG: hypothetical protein EOP24_38140 [Hyphomicrobiales bacterium]